MTPAQRALLEPHLRRAFEAGLARGRAEAATATFSDAPPGSPAEPSGFTAEDLERFRDYYAADASGCYPGNVHRAFGVGIKRFADATGLARRWEGGDRGGWVWVPRVTHRAADVPPTDVVTVPTSQIVADPDRFQFRPEADGDDGTVRELPEERFDAAKCEPLAVWRDPADGRTYVVDGHHRLAWAQRDGVAEVPVRFLDAKTAEEAYQTGVELNRADDESTFADGYPEDTHELFGEDVETFAGRTGLVQKEIEYQRGGKTFKRKQWVRAQEDKPAQGDRPATQEGENTSKTGEKDEPKAGEKPGSKAGAKPDAAAVHEEVKTALANPDSLTPEKRRDLTDKLKTLTVDQLKAIQTERKAAGGKNKDERIAKILDAARAKAAGTKSEPAAKAKPQTPAQQQPAKVGGYGDTGEGHPLAGMTRDQQWGRLSDYKAKTSGYTKDGVVDHDPMRLRAMGAPDGLDLKAFATDLASELESRGKAGYPEDLYAKVGEKHGLSKFDFLRATVALRDAGVLAKGGSSMSTDFLSQRDDKVRDPELMAVDGLQGGIVSQLRLGSVPPDQLPVKKPAAKPPQANRQPEPTAKAEPKQATQQQPAQQQRPASTAKPQPAQAARSFLDSIGVDHSGFGDEEIVERMRSAFAPGAGKATGKPTAKKDEPVQLSKPAADLLGELKGHVAAVEKDPYAVSDAQVEDITNRMRSLKPVEQKALLLSLTGGKARNGKDAVNRVRLALIGVRQHLDSQKA